MLSLHAKTAVIDGVWSTVGSTNRDFLSFLRNDEVNTIILNREFAAGMEKMFEADIAESDMILWEEWKKDHCGHESRSSSRICCPVGCNPDQQFNESTG